MNFSNELLGVEKIHHVAIAVGDMDKALKLWRDLLGFEPIVQDFPEHQMVESAFYVGEVQVQLYASYKPGQRFSQWVVDHGGDGPHHVCYQVADLSKTIQAIRDAGMDTVETVPGSGSQGTHVVIRPEYTMGCEIEFLELHDFLKGKTVEEQKKLVAEKFGK